MLYELALGQVEQWEIAPKFEDLLQDTSIQFIQGEVQNLDLSSGAVEGLRRDADSTTSFHIPYNRAVLALGAQVARISAVPGAEEYALPFYTLSDALRLKDKLRDIKKKVGAGKVVNVIVIGGGFSGVELASCLADDLGTAGSVMIIETSDRILAKGTSFNRRSAERALLSNSAAIEYRSRVTEVTKDSVTIEKNRGDASETFQYPADLVLWTAGSKPSSTLQSFGFDLDRMGRLPTDSFLQVEGNIDSLYALGDAASAPRDSGYYGTAQVAVQQAEYAAWNAWASLTGKPKLEYRYAHLGEMMVLGSCNATVTTSVGLELDGSAAWAARRIAYLARMPTEGHRTRVATSWASNPLMSGMEDFVQGTRRYGNV